MITATLAAWLPTLTFEALPPRARSRAKLAIFDACGTALTDTHHPAVQHLRQLIVEMGSAPQARLIGASEHTSGRALPWKETGQKCESAGGLRLFLRLGTLQSECCCSANA